MGNLNFYMKNKSHTPCGNTRYGTAATNPTKEDCYHQNYTAVQRDNQVVSRSSEKQQLLGGITP
jgi:hypothetical protein